MEKLWQHVVDFFAPLGDKWPELIFGLLIIVAFTLLSRKLTDLVEALIKKLFKRWETVGTEISSALHNPLRIFFIVLGVELAFLISSPETKWMDFINRLFRMADITLIAWVFLNYTPAATRLIIHFNEDKKNAPSEVAIRFMAVLLRIIIVSLLAVILISEMGYNINGIIAGLGLSGLTLSLAAQNTASNLFSGFEIITDKPFDVGDYIATASCEGFVEDITMRSTRIRTQDDLLITVPNSKLMKEAITNYSHRELGKAVQFTIGLTYDTTSDQIQKVCGDLRHLLETDPDIEPSILSVTFRGFSDCSQDIDVLYFTRTTDKFENLKVRERINFEIRRLVEEAGASFAFPTTTVQIEK